MREQDFTIQNIKDFMLEVMKYKWYGEVLDYDLGAYRDATIEDFKQLKRNELFVVEIRSEAQKNYYDSTAVQQLPVIIFGDEFRIPRGRDYSEKWQEFKSKRKSQTMNV